MNTIIEKIRAEVERLKEANAKLGHTNDIERYEESAYDNACDTFLSILSDLEKEEKPMNQEEELKKEIDTYFKDWYVDESDQGYSLKTPTGSAVMGHMKNIARHFAQWGANHLADARKIIEVKPGDEVTINGHKIVYDKDKGYVTIVESEESVPNDLEEAANNYLDGVYGKMPHSDFHIAIFIAGAKWQRNRLLPMIDKICKVCRIQHEKEKPVCEGLEEEISRYLREDCSDDDEPSISEVARHFAKWGAERFAKIVRENLPEIGNNAQSQFERLYFEITGTKMYGGYND